MMSPTLAWIALVTAGLLDVAWAVSMKYAEGYTRPGWSLRLGEREVAQQVRWRWFAETLSCRHFEDCLGWIEPAEYQATCRQAVHLAMVHPDVHAAILFLHDIGEQHVAVHLYAHHLHELAAGDPDTVLQLIEKIARDDEELSERLCRSAIMPLHRTKYPE
jgi:hypothetical protein